MSILKLDPHFKPAFDGPRLAAELVSKLKNEATVVEAYLFGSAATGKNSADSDLDILIVIPDSASVTDYYKIVTRAFFSEVATDWIFKSQTQFNSEKNVGGVAFIAYQNGIRLPL